MYQMRTQEQEHNYISDQQTVNLPGQVLSTDQSSLYVGKFSNSDSLDSQYSNFNQIRELQSVGEDFDLEKFRGVNNDINPKVATKTISEKPKIQRAKPGEIYRYLGQNFVLEYLQERNKDPKLLLNVQTFVLIGGDLFGLFIFVFGTNYSVIPSVLMVTAIMFSFIANILNLKQSVKNGLNFKSWGMLTLAFCMNCFLGALVYCFIWSTPFGSVTIYLLLIENLSFLSCLLIFFQLVPCTIPWDDEFYQTKYFMSLILLSILNATGMVDVFSDIVLGVQIILRFSGFLRILGFSLFFLCLMDLLIVSIRIIMPQKVSVKMHFVAFVLEVVILSVTFVLLFKVESNLEESDNELKTLMYLSVTTTCINFVHHVFIICDSFFAAKNERQPRNLATLFS